MKGGSGAKILALQGASYVLRGFKALLYLGVLCLLIAALLGGRKDLAKYPQLKRLIAAEASVEDPARNFLRAHIPTTFGGREVSRLILGVGAFILATLLGNLAMSLGQKAQWLKTRQDDVDEDAAALLGKLDKLQNGKLTRAELMEIMARTKKSLEKHKQRLAFLSIDVVNSTGMKLGEDPSVAERDFKRYKIMVDGILKDNRAFKAAWTPDGVMICFLETREAVLAGQQVIKELSRFNKEVKTIKHDFAVRVGINAGELLTEDSVPMEEMTDRVIDIAGHMQKHGAVNAVCVSEHAVKPLLKEFEFSPANREVDGCPVYEWKPT
ncbi:MAG: guanylate cyclase [Elusimicrobia bacterium]|nr:guanylate cyclase [Elusimicrobiota bacterium]